MSGNRLPLALSGAVLVYTAGFLLWYSATPLGLYPVLDGREILELARQIAAGELPAEPFYRAPLYPALLSLLIDAGVPPRELPFFARLLNAAFHLANAAFVWQLAQLVWRDARAAALACVLYGLNPVALHFAADPLDITFAITLMLAGACAGLRGLDARAGSGSGWIALASVLLALAALTRPQMMALLIAWFAWLTTGALRGPVRITALSGAVLAAVLVLAAMGAVNQSVGGEFRVLPWQGAYDLWAANKPGAHGRYYEQSTRAASYDTATNPARLESVRLFRAANPGRPVNPATVSSYWRTQLLAHVTSSPLEWFSLLARKGWYLLNNFEQYNNKTYDFHKARSPWLRYNPLCWAVVLALAAGALVSGWCRAPVRMLGVLLFAYACALLASYVSARFRLPVLALLAVLAGGLVRALAAGGGRGRVLAAAALAFAVSIVPMPAGEAGKTHVQDLLLLARANAELGNHEAALDAGAAALVRAPGHPAALELVCVSAFNRWLQGDGPEPASDACVAAMPASAPARRLNALQLWRAGRSAEAVARLEALVSDAPSEREAALAALLMMGRLQPADVRSLAGLPRPAGTVLLLALMLRGDSGAGAVLETRLSAAEIERQAASMTRLFARVPSGAEGIPAR